MKTSKDKKIHQGWNIDGLVRVDNINRFQYSCTRCKVKVLNGQPFSEVGAMVCS